MKTLALTQSIYSHPKRQAIRMGWLLPVVLLLALPGVLHGQCYTYTTNDGTITITGYTCSESVVSIPSTIAGLPVTQIGNYSFYYRSTLRSVTIPNSVTNIEYSAFSSCVNLTNAAIGSGVASIGNYAFSRCPNLMAITVDPANPTYSSVEGLLYAKNQTALWLCPGGKAGSFTVTNSVTFVGNLAFSSCTNLTSVTIPNSVTNIGYSAFSGCVGLTNVTIGNSVANIPNGAFWYCLNLKTITVASDNPFLSSVDGVLFNKSQTALRACPGGKVGSYSVPTNVVAISDGAFYSCGSLTSVTIPDSVTSIGYNAFGFCTNLTSVTMGKGVSSIGSWAFYDCLSLVAITVDPANPDYSSVDGVLFDKSQSTLWQCPGGKLGNYTVSHSVTTIRDSAFAKCFNLSGITIGTNVTSIGNGAFDSCTNLSSVTIPKDVTSIADSTFYYCTSLTNVSMPNTVTNIGDAAFAYCNSLIEVTIPNGVTGLGESAFAGCASLTSVTIPNGVTSIADSTFYNCISLTNVTIGDSVTNIGNAAFDSCVNLTNVTIGYSVTSIGDYAFAYCDNLAGIYFQGNAPGLGLDVFEGDYNATVYYLPGATGWGPTFGGLPTALWPAPLYYTYTASSGTITVTGYTGPGGAVTIPDTINGLPVTRIGESAFEACVSLTSVFIPNGITNIGNGAFSDCTSMTNITIPNGITSIGAWVFYGCTSLTSIIIPDNVATIGYRAFAECTGLTNVTMGISVIGIGNYAFAYCGSLKGVYFQGNAPSVEVSAFAGDDQATVYYLPWTTGWGPTLGGRPTAIWSPPLPYTYITNNGAITITGYTGSGGAVTIPAMINGLPVTRIGESAFESCIGLSSVTIPNSVTNIGPAAFASCTNLLTISLPNTVTQIGNGAFSDCTSLTNVTLPNGVTGMGAWVFYGCTSLTSLIIPDSVTTIGYRAFSECTGLTNVTVDAGVISIGGYAFAYCEGLRGIYFEGNAPSVEESAFEGANLTTVYYLPGTTGWGPTFGGRPTALWGVPAQTYMLSDYYYPLHNGNEWVYDSHGGGSTWTTIVRILQSDGPVTCYSNCNPAVTYVRSSASENFIQGDFVSGGAFIVDNSWTNYQEVGSSGWGWVGFDHDSGTQWRFEPGLIFPNQFAVGQTVSKTNVVYDHGVCAGQATFSLQLVGFADVQVPAGYFPKCMQLKLTYDILGEIRGGDEWWAQGVGPVKWTHIGGSDFETNELRSLTLEQFGNNVFPIATTVSIESGFAAAFDGTNYLVGVRGGPLAEGPITANLISQKGVLVATTNVPGESGGLPELAFDGTNYFMVWAGPSGTPGFNGQFISTTGGLVRSVLTISPASSMTPRAISLSFGDGKYLACWSDNTTIHGQFVTPGGQLEGESFPISGAVQQARENAIGFDGTNFFVVFNGSGNTRSNIHGRFVSPANGPTGGTVLINNSANPCDNPLTVVFDGTHYFVTFNEEVGGSFHVFARLVSTSGSVLGDKIIIANGPGAQHFPFSAFDGTSHLVSWSQGSELDNLTLTMRFFDRTGQPLGQEFSPIPAQGTNSPMFGAPLFDGDKYLVTAVLGRLTNGFNAASADVYGTFVPRLPRLDVLPPLGAGQFSLLLTGSSGFNYVIQMAMNPAVSNWIGLITNSPTNGTFSFTDNNATNTSRFYRAVMPLRQ